MKAFLERQYTDKNTIGRLWFDGKVVYTLELPWRDNLPNISCIPEGIYEVERTWSPAFKKNLWLIKDVKGRSGIRIHAANYIRELRGCIAPGMEAFDIDDDGIIDVSKSGVALEYMNKYIPDKFNLEIIWNKYLKI